MTKERAIRLAAKWAAGHVCTLREGEAQEYHELCLEALKQTQWISVKERLPEKEGTYLVCTDQKGVLLAHWYGEKFGGGYASKRITHWMPLPKPLEEDKK